MSNLLLCGAFLTVLREVNRKFASIALTLNFLTSAEQNVIIGILKALISLLIQVYWRLRRFRANVKD